MSYFWVPVWVFWVSVGLFWGLWVVFVVSGFLGVSIWGYLGSVWVILGSILLVLRCQFWVIFGYLFGLFWGLYFGCFGVSIWVIFGYLFGLFWGPFGFFGVSIWDVLVYSTVQRNQPIGIRYLGARPLLSNPSRGHNEPCLPSNSNRRLFRSVFPLRPIPASDTRDRPLLQ